MTEASNTREAIRALLDSEDLARYMTMLRKVATRNGSNPYTRTEGKDTLPENLDAVNGEEWPDDAKYGAYALTGSEWRRLRAELGLDGFTRENQDIAAAKLMDERGSLQPVLQGDLGGGLQLDKSVMGRTQPKTIAKYLGMDASGLEVDLPPQAPPLPPDALTVGDRTVVPQGNRDRVMREKIAAANQPDSIKGRMVDLHNALPQNRDADRRLLGDGLPREFDGQLRELIDRY